MYIYQCFKNKLSKCSAVALLAIPCFSALAQISDEAMHNSVVRIEVEQGPVISMASGFVWQQKKTGDHIIACNKTQTGYYYSGVS